MLRRTRNRLTYANVVASMALFVALGGVSYAAVKLPKNSVGSTQIKKNAVTGSKVRNSSLTGSDVKNSSLRGGDIKNSSLTGSDVRSSSLTGSDVKDGSLSAADFSGSLQGAQGPAGAQGAKGDPGPRGDTGPTDAVTSRPASAGLPLDPAPVPDEFWNPVVGEAKITTARPGRLLVLVTTPRAQASCTGSNQAFIGIYLDGGSVPGSNAYAFSDPGLSAASLSGATEATIPAGDHKVRLAFDCPAGDILSNVQSPIHVTAIVLGG